MSRSDQVLIAGAGPTGLTLAIELARRGVLPRVVEKAGGPINEARALGLSVRTLEVMDALGIIEPVIERAKRVHGFTFWDHHGSRLTTIPFAFEELATPYPLELLLPQDRIQRLLIQRFEDLGGHVEFGVELTAVDGSGDSPPQATLRHSDGRDEAVTPDWLVGADGASSRVRDAFAVPFEGSKYEEHFLLADVAIRWDLDDTAAHVFFHDEGTMFAFAYPEPGRWRLVDTTGQAKTGEPGPTLERFRHLLAGAGILAEIDNPTWTSLYSIHRRIVSSMRPAPRVFLIGDAAHVHSPVSGQGLNTGIQDGFNLGWKLALAANGRASGALLASLESERRPVAQSVLDSTDTLTRAIVEKHGFAARMRDLAFKALSEFSFVSRNFTKMNAKLDLGYRDSPIVLADASDGKGRLRAGDRAPALAPGSMGGGRGEMLSFLREPRHTLLVFADGDTRDLTDLAKAVVACDDLIDLAVVPDGAASPSGVRGDALVKDPTGALRRAYDADERPASAFLIRPDGYIAARVPVEGTSDVLARYLDRVCGAPAAGAAGSCPARAST